MSGCTVAIGTFGGSKWLALAERAKASAEHQAPVIHVHAGTLHDARNEALARVGTEWIVFLDADDELEDGYIDTLLAGTADLRVPAVRYVRRGRERPAGVPRVAGHTHDCIADCVTSGGGNWMVIGTMARTQLIRDIGGWRDWPIYEDFCLWMRALCAGATVEAIPAAVYRAHVNPVSRNRAPSMAFKDSVHRDIVDSILTHT